MTRSDILDSPDELALSPALRRELEQLKASFDQLDSGIIVYGPDDRILFCNARFRALYAEVADLLTAGTHYADLSRAFYRRSYAPHTAMSEDEFVAWRVAAHRDPAERDHELLVAEGRWLLVSDKKTSDGCVIGFRHDISARKKAELELEASEERFRSLLAMSSDWYWEQDEHYCFSRISGGMMQATRVAPKERYGKPRWEIPYLGISKEQMDAHRKVVEAHQPFRDFQYAYALESGEIWWVSITGEPLFDAAGTFRGYRGVGSNITEKKRIEAQIRELAEYDFLTGLPNRLLLGARFDFAVRQAERGQGGIALMFIDLDRFKNINDSLGHHIGDQILAGTARRLAEAVRTTDTVSRHGGDEFIVLLPGMADATGVAQLAETLIEKIAAPQHVGEHELTVTPSIGIAVWPADGDALNTLIQNADLAMYHSKSEGRNQFSFFRAEMNARVSERLRIENALRRALVSEQGRREFSQVYQPIFRFADKRVVGVEALMRWRSPELGDVAPVSFIPVAEESGLIVELGEWSVREACATLVRWRDAGLSHVPMTINLSGLQFKSRRILDVLQSAIAAHRLTPQDIEIELTESALVREGDAASGTLRALADAGFRLAVDDFGTGYSNLAYLKRFDISKLKIDQSFVRDITTDPDDAALTRGIIGLAKSLGLRVVAEGIEYPAQLEFLMANGCDEGQGFLLSVPVDAATFQGMY
jgi:diguanylate cyclase (GGDEF)-like protein/PAS domain S-box-containing protein